MKPTYDLKKMKVKRRGVLPELQKQEEAGNKIRITISLDKDVVDYFKAEAKLPGAFPYQTQINQALRKLLNKGSVATQCDINEIKSELLHDAGFIRELSKLLYLGQVTKHK